MINWVDVSSYDRNDKERIPSSWMCKLEKVDVRVHRHIHYGKDTWLLSSRFLNMEKLVLDNSEIELARREAIDVIKNNINRKIVELQDAMKQFE